jgi:predicted lipoprotein with Yx(FWY)xxD motif
MTRTRKTSVAVALLALAAIAAFGVAGSFGRTSPATHSAAAKKKPTLALRTTSLGKVLVDSKGRTLYLFGADTKKNQSNCASACAGNWPPAKAPSKPTVGRGVSKHKLKVIKRDDGTKQLSYAGHPLYRYVGDQKPGDVTGQDLDAFGGLWHVVAGSGKAITKPPQSDEPDPPPDPAY